MKATDDSKNKYASLIGWSAAGIIFLFIFLPLGIVLLITGVLIYLIQLQKINKQKVLEEKRKKLISEAEDYVGKIKIDKSIPTIKPSIFLNEAEHAFLEEPSSLIEPRAVRNSAGGGVGFRVAKGVYLGGYQGKSESHKEWRVLDSGQLIITNKKLIFKGSEENRTIPIKDIMAISPSLDSIQISLESKSKNVIFPVRNPYIWGVVINILRSSKNPLNLSDIKLDITLL